MINLRSRASHLQTGIVVVAALLLFAGKGFGQVTQLSQYTFTAGTCSAYDMSSGYTVLLGTNVDDGLSTATDIGFTFVLGGTAYTQFEANSNGYLTLGTAATSSGCCGYVITSLPAADRPAIAAFSEDLHNGSDGYVAYKLFGSAPNRVAVVHWKTREYPGSGQTTHTAIQIRLYEGSNKVEMWYGNSNLGAGNPGGIGIIINSSNWASVNSGVVSYSSATTSTFPNAGTCYSFAPCQSSVAFTGNVAQGGTTNMAEGDTLLRGFQVMRGSAGQTMPFTAYNGNAILSACGTRNYTFTIDGPHASDYSITPTSGTLVNGSSVIPTITFRPGDVGLRRATLRVTDDGGLNRTFELHGTGVTRIAWTGNIAQGGTGTVASGDTLINGTQVTFGTVGTFTPLTVGNINLDPLATPPALVTYTLNDPTGHYSISPSSTMLNGGQSSSVQISFNAMGDVGYQEATLTVTADGESRTYLLRAFNAAPGGELFEGTRRITGTSPLFVNRYACVGQEVISIEVTAFNTGAGDFIIYGASAYETDTVLGQGTPPYPLLMKEGQPIGSIDYFVSNAPGVTPKTANRAFDSIIIPEKQSRTFYVNMIPTRRGKRYGEIYFRTNAFNMSDPDVNGVPTRGTLKTGLFGHGQGAFLSGPALGTRPGTVAMNATEVREGRTTTAWLYNSGECDLRISRSEFRIQSGDIDEFELLSILPNTTVSGDDFILPPGYGDSVVVRFVPETYGSRRATVRLATNDSTLGDAAVIDRGVYYWDLFGIGSIGLEVRNLRLPPSVIDGPGTHGFVLLENTSAVPVEVQSLTLTGATGEIAEHGTRPWPATPFVIQPGQKVQLWVEINATGAPGVRNAELTVAIQGGKTAVSQISGYAGTRVLSVLPPALFNGMQVSVGDLARQYVTITNSGTLPVHLSDPVLAETNPGDYRVGPFPRHVLEPGQTELLEVTFTPQAAGPSSGTLTFSGNMTNGDQVVTLGGEGTTGTAIGTPAVTGTRIGDREGLNGAGKKNEGAVLSVTGITPNPASDLVRIDYSAGATGDVEIGLYDAGGRLIRSMPVGAPGAGDHTAELSVAGLASGTYYCIITQGDRTISHSVRVIR